MFAPSLSSRSLHISLAHTIINIHRPVWVFFMGAFYTTQFLYVYYYLFLQCSSSYKLLIWLSQVKVVVNMIISGKSCLSIAKSIWGYSLESHQGGVYNQDIICLQLWCCSLCYQFYFQNYNSTSIYKICCKNCVMVTCYTFLIKTGISLQEYRDAVRSGEDLAFVCMRCTERISVPEAEDDVEDVHANRFDEVGKIQTDEMSVA